MLFCNVLVYKKEVDWSLLMEGLTLPVDNQVVFGQIMGRFLRRGESKEIYLYLNGKSYEAKIVNGDIFANDLKTKSRGYVIKKRFRGVRRTEIFV